MLTPRPGIAGVGGARVGVVAGQLLALARAEEARVGHGARATIVTGPGVRHELATYAEHALVVSARVVVVAPDVDGDVLTADARRARVRGARIAVVALDHCPLALPRQAPVHERTLVPVVTHRRVRGVRAAHVRVTRVVGARVAVAAVDLRAGCAHARLTRGLRHTGLLERARLALRGRALLALTGLRVALRHQARSVRAVGLRTHDLGPGLDLAVRQRVLHGGRTDAHPSALVGGLRAVRIHLTDALARLGALAPDVDRAAVLCAEVVVVAVDRLAGARPVDAGVGHGARVTIVARDLARGRGHAPRHAATRIHGARVAIVTGHSVRQPVAVVVEAIAVVLGRGRRGARGQPIDGALPRAGAGAELVAREAGALQPLRDRLLGALAGGQQVQALPLGAQVPIGAGRGLRARARAEAADVRVVHAGAREAVPQITVGRLLTRQAQGRVHAGAHIDGIRAIAAALDALVAHGALELARCGAHQLSDDRDALAALALGILGAGCPLLRDDLRPIGLSAGCLLTEEGLAGECVQLDPGRTIRREVDSVAQDDGPVLVVTAGKCDQTRECHRPTATPQAHPPEEPMIALVGTRSRIDPGRADTWPP